MNFVNSFLFINIGLQESYSDYDYSVFKALVDSLLKVLERALLLFFLEYTDLLYMNYFQRAFHILTSEIL